MTQITEPLYVGIDVDALLTQFDRDDRRRAESRRAAGRRSAPKHSPLAEDIDAQIVLEGEAAPALRSSLLA